MTTLLCLTSLVMGMMMPEIYCLIREHLFSNANLGELPYSQTSRKRPPKLSNEGGRFGEVVVCYSLDHNGSKFVVIRICG